MTSYLGKEVDDALHELFNAYDLDESGELSRAEFIDIEMRLQFEAGKAFSSNEVLAKISKADKDRSGTLSFEEFRDRQLQLYHDEGRTSSEIVEHVKEHTRKALVERARMGTRYHAGVRQALKKIFSLYDLSGDGYLSPDEWLAAQKCVALEIGDDLDEAWIDEQTFSTGDKNKDGRLDLKEFLDSSFDIFDGVRKSSDVILGILNRMVSCLQRERACVLLAETQPLAIMTQAGKPDFKPPRLSWQDEPTCEFSERNADKWEIVASVALPLNLRTVEDICCAVRLSLQWPVDTLMSVFYCSPVTHAESGDKDDGKEGRPTSPICPELIRGEKSGSGNVQRALDALSKPHTPPRLYVKNVRKKSLKCERQGRVFLEDRVALLAKHIGSTWGLDWETMIVGEGAKGPWPFVITEGDAVAVEIPQTDDSGQYRYVVSTFMNGTSVLSQPVEQDVVVEKKKKKKDVANMDAPLQLHFIALREGQCVFFVEVSWEDQEETLAAYYGLTAPVAENTIARIGPFEVDVKKYVPAAYGKRNTQIQWWNGEKWSAKKGPAKSSKKR